MSVMHRIAVIAGDGIGKEVMPEGIRVLEAAGRKFGISFQWDELDWSCERFKRVGQMMPEDGLDRIKNHDAIYLGAVGYPGVPDHVSLWGLLIPHSARLRPICQCSAGPAHARRGQSIGELQTVRHRHADRPGEYRR